MITRLKKKISDNTFGGILRLSVNFLLTKLLYPKAKMIRFPIFIKGKKGITIGKNFNCGIALRIDCLNEIQGVIPSITIGDDVEINDYVHIGCVNRITIENNVLIASKVFITDHNHGQYSGDEDDSSPMQSPKLRKIMGNPIHIEENVWIGEMVTILSGVTIGKGSIIGANSVVTKDIPPFTIAVGSPAKVIKHYNFDKNIWTK